MMSNVYVLGALGLLLHVAVGIVAGRLLGYLIRARDGSEQQRSQWIAYGSGLSLLVGYSVLAGLLAEALQGHDTLMVLLAAVMLAVFAATYRRRRG
jgi:uncharacterized membrane protein YoaK (UPF0700 family)